MKSSQSCDALKVSMSNPVLVLLCCNHYEKFRKAATGNKFEPSFEVQYSPYIIKSPNLATVTQKRSLDVLQANWVKSFLQDCLKKKFSKLNVLRAGMLIIQVFWGVTSCRLISIYQSTQRNIPNNLNIQTLFYMYKKKNYTSGRCPEGRCSYKSLREVSEPENKMWERVYAPDLGYMSRFSSIKQPTAIRRPHAL
jgi:hypothetical protein